MKLKDNRKSNLEEVRINQCSSSIFKTWFSTFFTQASLYFISKMHCIFVTISDCKVPDKEYSSPVDRTDVFREQVHGKSIGRTTAFWTGGAWNTIRTIPHQCLDRPSKAIASVPRRLHRHFDSILKNRNRKGRRRHRSEPQSTNEFTIYCTTNFFSPEAKSTWIQDSSHPL